MERKEWTLIAINFANERGLSPVQLQKSLFLIGRELPKEAGGDFYDFTSHNWGPFSKQVYLDAEELATEGFVVIECPAGSYANYRITVEGAARARALSGKAPPRYLAHLKNVVEWSQRQTFSGLVRAIYDKYPEYRLNSVFRF